MKSFKELLTERAFNYSIEEATVKITGEAGQTLYLKIDKSETIQRAVYGGPFDPWLTALCALITGRKVPQMMGLTPSGLASHFREDQTFCDLWSEREAGFVFVPLELLRAALDSYQGREQLYLKAPPLVCMCFGVREDEILKDTKTRAGMGCRTCRPMLERLLNLKEGRKIPARRYYKEMPFADWLLITDEKLQAFPFSLEWEMEAIAFKGKGIVITYKKNVPQKEEEEMARRLQDFLGALVDPDLSFFLRRS